MSDEYRDLERELRELGPLMDEQARLEQAGPDPAFATQLRARLVARAAERAAPTTPRRPRFWPRWSLQWGGLGAAVAVAAVVALLLLRQGGTSVPVQPGAKTALFVPPTPTKIDVTKSYPILGGLGGGGGPPQPTQSRIALPIGQPYPTRLTLSHSGPFSAPHTVRAYRLQDARYTISRIHQMARALDIQGTVRRVKDYDRTGPQAPNQLPPKVVWLVIQHGSGDAMRSIAVSTRTGAVIYHDLTLNRPQLDRESAPSQTEAIASARAWLKHLGWPGDAMPQGPKYLLNGPGSTAATFGWPGVPLVDQLGAAVTVRHGGKVAEALLLPPIQASTDLKPRTVESAWQQVQSGKAPVGVEEYLLTGPKAPTGTGSAQAVSVEEVVTVTPSGRIYLVPSYRFSGTVKLQGVSGTKPWFALVPATWVPG